MLNKIILPGIVAFLAALLMPTKLDAYGAARASYTHVGPGGVTHASAGAVRGGYGGGGYHYSAGGAGYGGAYHASGGGYTTAGGARVGGGYHYSASYGGVQGVGGVTGGGAHYSYVR